MTYQPANFEKNQYHAVYPGRMTVACGKAEVVETQVESIPEGATLCGVCRRIRKVKDAKCRDDDK